jgi:outer membrane protein assembly factor BamB
VTAQVAFILLLAPAADWPRFRGPNGSGVGEAAKLPAEFSPQRNVRWKAAAPAGHSSPVVAGERVFLTGLDQERLVTLCLDRATGKELWRRECPRPRRERLDKRNHPASPTPAVEGRNVFVFFPDFGVISYDTDGKERWRAPLGPFDNLYGMGSSPVAAGDKVILSCDQTQGSFLIALDAGDGRVRWRTPRPEAVSGHSTPALYRGPGGATQVIAPGSFRLDAYSAATGEPLWWVRGLASEMKSAPVVDGETIYINGYNLPENDPGRHVEVPPFEKYLADHDKDGDGRIAAAEAPDQRMKSFFPYLDLNHDGYLDAREWKMYVAAMAAENGLLAIRAGGRGDMTDRSVKWKYHRSIPQLPSVLLYQGVLYMLGDNGVLTTLDPASGTVHRQARLRGVADRYFASPVAGDGKVFIVGHSCTVSVLRPGPEQELLAVNELEGECFATPAIAGDAIFIRTSNGLFAFALQ